MVNRFINIEYLFSILFILFYQIVIMPRTTILGVVPNIALIIAVWIALVKTPRRSLFFGFFAGFSIGLLTPADLGWEALLLGLIGMGLSVLKDKIVLEAFPIRILTLFIISMLYQLIFLILSRYDMVSGNFPQILLNTFLTTAYTTMIGTLIYGFIKNRYILRNLF